MGIVSLCYRYNALVITFTDKEYQTLNQKISSYLSKIYRKS